jgi:hypothetical protein
MVIRVICATVTSGDYPLPSPIDVRQERINIPFSVSNWVATSVVRGQEWGLVIVRAATHETAGRFPCAVARLIQDSGDMNRLWLFE